MIDKKFNTNALAKIGFKQSENPKEWYYKLDRYHSIAYHTDFDTIYFSSTDEEVLNIDLKIFTISELIRRLPLLTDFALLIETYY